MLILGVLSANSAAEVIAFDMVGNASQNLNSFTNPWNSAFGSPADGFQKYQRGVSATIPFAVLDDSLVIFPGDSLGIIKDGNNNVFFGTTDTENPDNSGPVSATWVFDISSATAGLALSIDMGAMGDFESSDTFEWTYSIDGGPVLTAFASSVDEAGAVTYTLEGGAMFPLDDPMLVQGTILTDDLASLSTPLVGTGSTLMLTLTASTNGGTEAFAFQNIIVSDAVEPPPFGVCGDPATFIHDVQGAGLASPLDGMSGVVLEGVVVGDFENTATELSGFFVQEEDSDTDADTMTSEGIFVFNSGFGPGVAVGDVVRVEGTVDEFFSLTELTNVTNLVVCPGNPPATAASVSPPVTSLDVWETVEGMLVTIPQTLYVSGNFNQGRFGEVDLSVDAPLDNPTNVAAPGAPALAVLDLNDRSRIQLDDGSNVQNPLPLPPYIGTGNTLRTGDTIAGLTAVMSFSFGAYELHPVGPVNFTRVNTRLDPPSVGGAVRVASFNVLNYFTTLDGAGPICGPLSNQGCRGADNALEFTQQRDKLVAAITKLDAHVVGVIEIENHFFDVPIADLVDGLNDQSGPGTYDYIPTGAIGIDVIRVGFIYQPASVSPVNPFAVLDSSVDPLFIDTENRPVLAQSFSENTSGEVFTVAVNHLKSKGSDCDDIGDPDVGDGQGNCNVTRTTAAQALVDWLEADPTGSDSDNFLIIGDLNAYAQEDPVTTIEFASYVDLIEAFVGTGVADGAYSFNFLSESGALDHALASPGMTANVTGAAIWHINADEPRALDYNDFNQPALFNADEFRSSDHDPVLVGLFDDSDDDGVLDVVDVCPGTVIPESVPTQRLGVNRWALIDSDFEFDTIIKGNGKGPNRSYTTEDTAGCSCEQIIEAQGLGQGHTKFGCSIGVMDNWVELVTP